MLSVERNGKEFITSVYSRKSPPKGQGPLGIIITSFIEKKYSWFQAPIFGIIESLKISFITLKELIKLLFNFITFQKTNLDVVGPIGIAKITSQAVKFGNNAVLQVLGLLSLNLAVINILPFPALDGGRLAFIVYEVISRKKVSPKIERQLNLIGFAILLTLIILVSINDIIKLF
jgi:regulator of sigma E protease